MFLDAETRPKPRVEPKPSRLPRTEVSHLKVGGQDKRVTRSAARELAENDDDCMVVATHPPGTVTPSLPMSNVPMSLPMLPSASTDAPSSTKSDTNASSSSKSEKVKVATEKSRPSRSKLVTSQSSEITADLPRARKSKEKSKKEKETKVNTGLDVKKKKSVSKSSNTSIPSTVASNKASDVISSASSAYVSSATLPNTSTVSITATQVTSQIQKQFGDKKSRSGSTSAPVVTTKSAPVIEATSYPGFNVPSSSTRSAESAVSLMSTIRPKTPDLMPARSRIPPEIQISQRSNPAPVSSSSTSLSSQIPTGSKRRRSELSPSPSSPTVRRAQDTTERGRSRSRSDYRPSVRSTSIPVRATFSLLPAAGLAPDMNEYDYGLQQSKQHIE